jgi:hypothetical protein
MHHRLASVCAVNGAPQYNISLISIISIPAVCGCLLPSHTQQQHWAACVLVQNYYGLFAI